MVGGGRKRALCWGPPKALQRARNQVKNFLTWQTAQGGQGGACKKKAKRVDRRRRGVKANEWNLLFPVKHKGGGIKKYR